MFCPGDCQRLEGEGTVSGQINRKLLNTEGIKQFDSVILAEDDIQFQDSSKVNYSTIKVCSDGGGD